MVFSSQIFVFIFLPIALLGYYLLRKDFRDIYLLLISFFFYAWAGPRLLLVLLISILINYFGGLLIHHFRTGNNRVKQAAVIFPVLLNLGLLGYFKYFNFFMDTVNSVGGLELSFKEVALPLGISYFTFSGISYLLDLKSGRIEPQKNPIQFALYMSLFVKLMQGPISRYKDFISQISLGKFADGIFRFVTGLAKKVIIADQLGIMVDQIFANQAVNNSIPVAWLGAVGYALQIFFDFSGYTDMAIGLGKMFGFDIAENFNYPYIATSITEFWRRWHMTLSTWFRDYVFYPLEFKRLKRKGFTQAINTFIVFILVGLWHGATWNFVLWGMYQGLLIMFENTFRSHNINLHLPRFVKWMLTMVALLLSFVVIRSPDLPYAIKYLGVMLGMSEKVSNGLTSPWNLDYKTLTFLVIGLLACVPWKQVFPRLIKKQEGTIAALILKDIGFVILLVLSISYVIASSFNPFIYFKY